MADNCSRNCLLMFHGLRLAGGYGGNADGGSTSRRRHVAVDAGAVSKTPFFILESLSKTPDKMDVGSRSPLSRLERLPPELRLEIYPYLLSTDRCTVDIATTEDGKTMIIPLLDDSTKNHGPSCDAPPSSIHRGYSFTTGLFGVNKLIGEESHKYFREYNNFVRVELAHMFNTGFAMPSSSLLEYLPSIGNQFGQLAAPYIFHLRIPEQHISKFYCFFRPQRLKHKNFLITMKSLELFLSAAVFALNPYMRSGNPVFAKVKLFTGEQFRAALPLSKSKLVHHMDSLVQVLLQQRVTPTELAQGHCIDLSIRPSLNGVLEAARIFQNHADNLSREGRWSGACMLYNALMCCSFHYWAGNCNYDTQEARRPDLSTIRHAFQEHVSNCSINGVALQYMLLAWNFQYNLSTNTLGTDIQLPPPLSVDSVCKLLQPFFNSSLRHQTVVSQADKRQDARAARILLLLSTRVRLGGEVRDLLPIQWASTNLPPELQSSTAWYEAVERANPMFKDVLQHFGVLEY